MAEDEDLEQDSEAYRKWRSGNDNDKYASSKTPSETGSKSGSYSIPKPDDGYALPGEEDNSGGGSWLDGEMNWPIIIAAIVIFALISSTIVAFLLSSSESDSKPSEWPETEGTIIEQTDSKTFIDDNNGEDYCEDENDDGWLDDWECWNDFVFGIELRTQYSVDQKTYQTNEYIEFRERHWVDVLKEDGGKNEERLFENFTNYWNEETANGSISLNSTISVTYNPENPKDAYSEFVEQPGDPTGFIGWFLMCCGGMLCIPVVIVGVIMSWAKRATGMGGYNNRRGWGPFGGYFGGNHRGSGRNRRSTRRSGGTSRSGGGGRSGSGSRGGGGRSGGGGRRR